MYCYPAGSFLKEQMPRGQARSQSRKTAIAGFDRGAEPDVIVVVGAGLEARASRLIQDAGGVVDGQRVKPGCAVMAHFQGRVAGAEEAKLGPPGKPRLEQKGQNPGGGLRVERRDRVCGDRTDPRNGAWPAPLDIGSRRRLAIVHQPLDTLGQPRDLLKVDRRHFPDRAG